MQLNPDDHMDHLDKQIQVMEQSRNPKSIQNVKDLRLGALDHLQGRQMPRQRESALTEESILKSGVKVSEVLFLVLNFPSTYCNSVVGKPCD